MPKNPLIPLVIIVSTLTASVSLFVLHEKKTSQNTATQNQTISTQEEAGSSNKDDQPLKTEDNRETFVTDIDMDVSHWQTKKTEYFTVKFPKEWYWMEESYGKDQGHSEVITNNPHFDLSKYPYISFGAGIDYPLTLTNNTEIVVTMSGVAGTAEEGSAVDSINAQIKYVKEHINSNAVCSQNNTDIPYPTAQCSFVDKNNQSVHVFFVAEKSFTYAFTAWTTQRNTANMEKILEDISRSYIVPER